MLSLILNHITLEGEIRDSLNQKIPFAVIRVKELKKGTYSDERGYFYLKLPDGRWTIEVNAIGKKTYTFVVEGRDTVINKTILLKDEPLTTPEIIITAKREEFKKGTGQAIRFKAEVIRQIPTFITADVLRTIQDFPGVLGLADFSGKFSVRSGGPNENAVLLDNATIFNPYHLGGFFSVFDSDALESFTFYRSNFPPKFGGVMSSVLDMKTLEPDSIYGNLSISLLATKVLQTFKGERFGGLVSLRRSYFDATLKLFHYDFPYYFYDALGKVYYNLNDKWTVSTTFMHGRDHFNFTINRAFLKTFWGNDLVAFNSRVIFGNWINFTTFGSTYFTNGISVGYENQNFVSIKSPMDLTEFKTNFISISEDREVSMGLDVQRGTGKFEQEFFGSNFQFSGMGYASAIFGEYMLKRGLYNLSLGFRINAFLRKLINDPKRDVIYLNPEPRITFKIFLTPDVALKGGFGIFHQYYVGLSGGGGTLGEVLSSFYYWVPVYGGFEPERAHHYSLGLSGITPWGDWEIEGFYKNYPYILIDNPNVDPNDIFGTLFRKGYGWAYGFDGYVRKDMGRFRGMVSYSFLVGRVKISDSLMNSPYDRRNAVIITLSYDIRRGFEGGFRFAYQSGLPYTGAIGRYDIYTIYDPGTGLPARLRTEEIYSYPYSLRYPPYHRADVYISKTFSIKRFKGKLSISVINIYNRENVFTYFYDYSKDPPQRITIPQLPLFPSLEIFLNW